jgi:protein-tyrosine phosphatase
MEILENLLKIKLTKMPIKILFVCLGNICRSPLAEGTFRELVAKKNLSDKLTCDSAGTAGYHLGQLPDHRSIDVAAEHGIKLTHRGRKLIAQDFDNFEHIVVMDSENFEDVHKFYYQTKHTPPPAEKLFMLGDYDPLRENGKPSEIPDPYYGNKQDFENVFQQVWRSNEALLQHFVKRYDLHKML